MVFSFFSHFLLTSAYIWQHFLRTAYDVRCRFVTSLCRMFTKISEYVYLTKILNLYKFELNPIIFLENMAINVPEHAKIWEISGNMRKSTYRHNFVKNDQIDLNFGQNHDFMEINRFWEFYKNLERWRHVTSHHMFFEKMG